MKNIAEKLAKVKFWNFKLCVSKDFHFDWSADNFLCLFVSHILCRHEHLYEKIEANVIRTDNFPRELLEVERILAGSRVILCTLSMLSNPLLAPFTKVVPVETIILDEASQIEIGDYIPPLCSFRPTLRKLVFIGDDKQRIYMIVFLALNL